MSIHKSKGLEFPIVFLCNLARRFNPESQRAQVLCDKELGLGLAVVDNETRIRYSSISKRAIAASIAASSVSEEMRVLYVAMTRARDRLIMTYAAKRLAGDLEDIALRLPFDGGKLLGTDAGCPGDWILTAAMTRTEAGELHALGGSPGNTQIGDYPWKICVVQTAPGETEHSAAREEEERTAVPFQPEELRSALDFRYPYAEATHAPSKQTATGRKGRSRVEEAAENTAEPKHIHRAWRRPAFREMRKDGRAYGNAFHAVMQFIRYEACKNQTAVNQEIDRLVLERFLTEEQGTMVDREKIAAFFQSEIGRKLCSGTDHLREFKFSILDNGSHYGAGLEQEQVLLQGVVDCALLEPDGITIVDYKTDHVTEETIGQAVERYRVQLDTYADALKRIYESPIKEKYLYFFHLNRFVRL